MAESFSNAADFSRPKRAGQPDDDGLAGAPAGIAARLPQRSQQNIVAAQLALGSRASLERRVAALLRQCPTLHKLGQVVAHDQRLAPSLRRRLQELESLPPTTTLASVQADLRQAIGGEPGVRLGRRPLAEGSVAVVVPFAWQQSGQRTGVLKVLRPGIEARLSEELFIWTQLGGYLEERCRHYGLPHVEFQQALASVARLLAREVRLDEEQRNLTEAGERYRSSPGVIVPRLMPFCTARVTAMQRVSGVKVTQGTVDPAERRCIANRVAGALLAEPFWNGGEAGGIFHGDPHAGNLLRTPEGQLVLLDWALVIRLTPRQREVLVQLVLSALLLDAPRLCRTLADLAVVCDDDLVFRHVTAALGTVREGEAPGMNWLTGLLDGLVACSAIRLPDEIIVFRKALLSLQGVMADLCEQPILDRVLIAQGVGDLIGGMPWRPWINPGSRAFGGYVSNFDLLSLSTALPILLGRLLTGRAA